MRVLLLLAASLLVVPAAASAQPDPSGEPFTVPGFDLQGHRGARGLAPENTTPAFRRALELGVTTLEMDVVISEDGKVVVSHDPWMSHVICSLPSGGPVPAGEERSHNLYRMSYAEIEQYDCGRRRHPDFPKQKSHPAVKPLLRDVIAMAEEYVGDHDRPPVFYNVEIKSRPAWDGQFHPAPEAYARRVLDVVHQTNVAPRTTIQSFDPRALRAARQLRSDRGDRVPKAFGMSLLVGGEKEGSMSDHLAQLGFTPAVYSPNYRRVDAALLQAARDHGLRVVPWTVNERDEMRRLIQLGVKGLITDYPDRAQEVLQTIESSSN